MKVRWLLIWWLFLVSAVAYLDRVNISIAGQAIAKEFHLNTVELGWMFSAFVLGYALFQAPGGWLADRIGPRILLAIGVVWWAVFTSAITLFSARTAALLPMLIGVRFCLGLGEAVVYPASNTVVSAWIPTGERGIANGVIFAGVGFGAGITPPLITYVLLHSGWRPSFWLSAGLGLLVGSVWYAIARDTPAGHPWVSRKEAEVIESGLPRAERGGSRSHLSWGTILGNRDVMAVTLSYFCYGYAAYIFFSWFFIYLNAVRGLNLRQSSYYTMLPFLAMAAGSPLGGWISDWITRRWHKRAGRCWVAAAAMLLAAVFIGVGSQVRSAQLASFVLAGGAGALYLSQSSFWSVTADIGKRSAGSVSGIMNMGGQLGGALTSWATAAIANVFGWNASFAAASAMCFAGAILWLFVRPEGKPD
jgi:MFS transporter, ACS family, glucarate transporter